YSDVHPPLVDARGAPLSPRERVPAVLHTPFVRDELFAYQRAARLPAGAGPGRARSPPARQRNGDDGAVALVLNVLPFVITTHRGAEVPRKPYKDFSVPPSRQAQCHIFRRVLARSDGNDDVLFAAVHVGTRGPRGAGGQLRFPQRLAGRLVVSTKLTPTGTGSQ